MANLSQKMRLFFCIKIKNVFQYICRDKIHLYFKLKIMKLFNTLLKIQTGKVNLQKSAIFIEKSSFL